MTAPEWRDCADPDELAAAVAAGVEVRDAVRLLDLAWGVIANADGWGDDTSWRQAAERWRDGYHRFLDALREEPTAPPADDLRDTDPGLIRHLRDMADRWGARGVMVTGAALWPDALPESPAPPWPGAVLSGLTDEDGVPTWLAQAGQVRGEQVRGWRDVAWYRPDGHSSDTWVEVRAPRAVPEPETEAPPDPVLIEALHNLSDSFGPRGVLRTAMGMWPDAMDTTP